MRKLILYLVLLFSFTTAFGQDADGIDTSFGSVPGFNGRIYETIQQPDDKLLVGGNFTKYKGDNCKYLVRLLSDGTVDTGFNIPTSITNAINQVSSIAIQEDGKLVVSCQIGTYAFVVRLNSDGSIDTTFTFSYGSFYHSTYNTSAIYKTVVQPDGKIILAGTFRYFNSIDRRGILRLNADGSLDTTFNPGYGFDSIVRSIALQPDGKMIVVGDFENYNLYARNKIIRLNPDGTVDLSFSTGTGFTGQSVNDVLIQSDGKIVVAGNFTQYKNVDRKGLIRLLPNGDNDTFFDIGAGFSGWLYFKINKIAIDNSGNIVVGGQFDKYNNVDRNNCVRINSNGSLDTSFTAVQVSEVFSVLIQNDQKVILGGVNYITRLNNNSSFDSTFDYGSGFNNTVNTTLIQPDGKIIVGGQFNVYQLLPEKGFLRLNSDGTKDNTFNVDDLTLGQTEQLLLQPNGKILAFGTYQFTYSPIGQFINLVRFNQDGSQDTTFTTAYFSGNCKFIALQPDGKILAGGNAFLNVNGLVRFNSDGTIDTSFNIGSGFNSTVHAVAVQPDGKIIVVGLFTSFNGEPHKKIVRLLSNGTLDATFNEGEGIHYYPQSICIQPDGKILVGGSLQAYNAIPVGGIVRINADGSFDSSFSAALNITNAKSMVIQSDGKIIVGGEITAFMGNPLKNLMRLNPNGTIDSGFDIETGFDDGTTNVNGVANSLITNLNLQSDGKILVGGKFNKYKSFNSAMLIRLNGGNSTMSNEDFSLEKFVLYPNPTANRLNISLVPENGKYEIIDYLGREVKNGKLDQDGIDVSELNSGVYFIRVISNQQSFCQKFIKK